MGKTSRIHKFILFYCFIFGVFYSRPLFAGACSDYQNQCSGQLIGAYCDQLMQACQFENKNQNTIKKNGTSCMYTGNCPSPNSPASSSKNNFQRSALRSRPQPSNPSSKNQDQNQNQTQTPSPSGAAANSGGNNNPQYSIEETTHTPTGMELGVCRERMQGLVNNCLRKHDETETACDDTKDPQMMSAQKAIGAFGQVASNSIQTACSGMGKVGSIANAALAAYKLSCQNAISDCDESCTSAVKFYQANNACMPAIFTSETTREVDAMMKAKQTCDSLVGKVGNAQQSIESVMGSIGQAANCASLTSGVGALPAICKTNPNLPGCIAPASVDCSNPTMASNKVCLCAKTPNDPSCININSPGSQNPIGAGSGANLKNSNIGGDGIGGDLPGLPEIPIGQIKSGDSDSGVDGKQGTGAVLGDGRGGSGSGGGRQAGGGASSADPQNVNAGFYGSGSSGGAFSNSAAGEGGGGYGGGNTGLDQEKDPNLRQFLPGGAMDPRLRGLAGAYGATNVDGITGPNTNIWSKIQNRYNMVSPTLMP